MTKNQMLHLVVMRHSIQRLHQICCSLQDHFLYPQEKDRKKISKERKLEQLTTVVFPFNSFFIHIHCIMHVNNRRGERAFDHNWATSSSTKSKKGSNSHLITPWTGEKHGAAACSIVWCLLKWISAVFQQNIWFGLKQRQWDLCSAEKVRQFLRTALKAIT